MASSSSGKNTNGAIPAIGRDAGRTSLREQVAYGIAAVREAWRRSLASPGAVLSFVVGGAATVGLGMITVGDKVDLTGFVRFGLIPVVGGGVAGFLTLLLVNIITEPARRAKRQAVLITSLTDERDEYEAAVAEKTANQALADALQDLYDHGLNQILNGLHNTRDALTVLLEQESEWREKIIDTMSKYRCSKQETSYVRDLQEVPTNGDFSPDVEINHVLQRVSERLKKLRDIIYQYAPIGGVKQFGLLR